MAAYHVVAYEVIHVVNKISYLYFPLVSQAFLVATWGYFVSFCSNGFYTKPLLCTIQMIKITLLNSGVQVHHAFKLAFLSNPYPFPPSLPFAYPMQIPPSLSHSLDPFDLFLPPSHTLNHIIHSKHANILWQPSRVAYICFCMNIFCRRLRIINCWLNYLWCNWNVML